MSDHNTLRNAIAAALTMGSFAAAPPLCIAAEPQQTAQQVRLDIDAQMLASALSAYAVQTHQQILVAPELTQNKRTSGLKGVFKGDEGLQQLLLGTGLTFSRSPDGIILVSLAVPGKTSSADGPKQPVRRQQSTPAPAASPEMAESILQEIIVTATGRAESIQNIPYNISAITGAALQSAGVSDFHKLAEAVGGLAYADVGPRGALASNFVIRGINIDGGAAPQFPAVTQPPVSTYINTTPIFANLWFLDLDRVEVLRGPQGTLYGANSEGGTVRFIYNEPKFDSFTADISGDAGFTSKATGGNYQGVLTMNVPLAEHLALRATAGYNRHSGFIDAPNRYSLAADGTPALADPGDPVNSLGVRVPARGINWDSTTAFQAALRWAPSEQFDATLSYHHQIQNSGGSQLVSYQAFTLDSFKTSAQVPEDFHSTVDLGSLEITSAMGFATFTSSTSYFQTRARAVNDFTGFYFSFPFYTTVYGANPRPLFVGDDAYDTNGFVQEFRLTSPSSGPFRWVAGAFYERLHTKTKNEQYARGYTDFFDACISSPTSTLPCGFGTFYPDIPSFLDGRVINAKDFSYLNDNDVLFKDIALYADFEWRLTDQWRLLGGIRGFRDSSTNDEVGGLLFLGPTGVGGSKETTTDNGVLGKIGVSYNFTPSNMAYALFSQGNRPAGTNGLPVEVFNFDGSPTPTSPALFRYRSDTVNNFEIGAKGTLADRIRYTLTYFDIHWNRIQLGTNVTSLAIEAIINAGNARSNGVELELNGQITDRLTASLNYTHANARLTSVDPPEGVDPSGYSVGQGLPGVPRDIGNFMLQYAQPLPQGMTLAYAFSANYRGRSNSSLLTSTNLDAGGFATYSPAVSLSTDNWLVRLYADNVTNRVGAYGYASTNWGAWSGASITRPRTVGLSASYSFR